MVCPAGHKVKKIKTSKFKTYLDITKFEPSLLSLTLVFPLLLPKFLDFSLRF